MYMSARRTGASGLPREVALQSQAAAAAESLASRALASSACPGCGLLEGFGGGASNGLGGAGASDLATPVEFGTDPLSVAADCSLAAGSGDKSCDCASCSTVAGAVAGVVDVADCGAFPDCGLLGVGVWL